MTLLLHYPLRYLVLGILTGFAIVTGLLTYLTTRPVVLQHVEQQASERLRVELTHLQGVLQLLLRTDNLEAAQSVVAALGSAPEHELALLTNAAGNTLASTRLADIGAAWATLDLPLDRSLIEQAGSAGGAVVQLAAHRLTGYVTVCAAATIDTLRPRQCGFLVQQLNLTASEAAAIDALHRQAVGYGLGLAVVAGVLGLIFHSVVTRRAERLIVAVNQFTAGDPTARAGLQGRDELAQVSDAFDAMALTIATNQQQLQELNTQLAQRLTERAQAETALRQNEQRLAHTQQRLIDAIESLSDGFVLYDAEDRLVLCNRHYYTFYDVHPDQLPPGATFEAVVRASVAQGHIPEAIGREEAWVQERVAQHRQPGGPIERRLANGRWLQLRDHVTTDGGVVGIRTDITALKQREQELEESETRYRTLVESSIQGISVSQQGGRRVFANAALAAMLGYAEPHDLIGMDVMDEVAPHERARLRVCGQARLRGESVPSRYEYEGLRTDGAPLWLERSVSLIPWEGEQAFLHTVVDITERKQAEDALQRAHDELEQRVRERTAALQVANEEVRRFAYLASHDLRTPLVNLQGFAGELRASCHLIQDVMATALPHLEAAQRDELTRALEVEVPEALDFIEASASRMGRLIEAILDVSRHGNRELRIEPLNLSALVQEVVQSLAHQITQYRAQVTLGALPDIQADRAAMEHIVSNLLTNAVAYLDPDRPGDISVSAERNADFTTIQVRDNGRGIATEDIPRVFELFRRVGPQTVAGEGIGLSSVQTLVRRHGGEIQCDSTLGVGTTFWLTISNDLGEGTRHADR